ncbi:PREDICTED: 65-kDa microtubule-associated protein 3-like [Brassica oleracea var. oleracea]|uniref:65-kDa microtubule-associated protein 3 n=1 Tax=Brassica oleracea var. oleracea TaxID=109376 RepID=A0A0D3EA44_BRAOL|nr:PREDICTED: 65-kDa microtubule-associated protein 3-like [Brassica oleracea var. oleracea]XP_013606871.1 PREDICTED: 65-kDa microtubule-associated protein 3-like [Brassica oleracea var. oleracea]
MAKDPILQVETTCGSLLYELQIIWDEVGETETDRDKMLLELERECLEVYRRKVDQANRCRAQLRQAIADAEAELASICSAMGERPVHIRQSDQSVGSLKLELGKILPELEEMQKRKIERRNQFLLVLEEVENITNDIKGQGEHVLSKPPIDETDLSMRKLEELNCHLQALQKEKSDRVETIRKHLCTLYSHCSVLGMDFNEVVSQVNPTLTDPEGPRSLSDHTIDNLDAAVQKLREVKIQRMQKLQDLATTMLELWNLMDTPIEEQQEYQHITCNIAASEHEITQANSLSEDFIKYVEAEVVRLGEVKASKMKELVVKKRSELEEICRKTHMLPVSDSAMDQTIVAIESGIVDATLVLEHLEQHISKVKEEALSRKEILEKVEKWLSACDEESWLEEYNRDDNRYNAGRGAHLTLKRAEKARNLVNKLPVMVEALASKTIVWEREKGIEFLYDGIRLLSMLEEYNLLRQEREEEHRRQRDHKKLQGQLIAEQEALYGSKPSPSKPLGGKKAPRMSTGGTATNRRLSLGAGMHQTPKPNKKADQRQVQVDGALSTGRRGLDVAGLPSRKQSMNPCEQLQSPLVRKPFSPISTTVVASKANIATPQQLVPNSKSNAVNEISSFATPVKNNNIIKKLEEEKMMMMMQTPKNVASMIPIPSTPATISVPMQTAPTPLNNNNNARFLPEKAEVIEYSFEERRLAFMLQSESPIHV